MEPAKIEKFFEIIFLYKGRYPIRRTHHNEEYREEKIYNFWLEFDEKLTWIWLSMQRVYYSFLCQSSKSMEITFDRIISLFAFCPPHDTYAYNFDHHLGPGNIAVDQYDLKKLTGEILLSHFVASPNNHKLRDIYQQKFVRIAKYIQCFYAYNRFGNRIACIYIRQSLKKSESVKQTIVYSHTNAEDIGTILSHLWKMKRKIKSCNVFAYDYSGYGMSSGSPSERNLYADIEAATNELMNRKNIRPKDLILFGESIGSAPTIHMAAKRIEARGVILQSSFMSGIRIYFPYNMSGGETLPFDPFANIDRCSLIESPTLVIHGSEDMLVNIGHAITIYEHLKNPVQPFWANGASHMNIHKHPDYYDRLNNFLESL
nr:alpha/beta hydrolase domain-containing protein 17B-like [Dermatophagoides farinae]